MKYRPENTLAHFNAAPQTHIHDLSALPVSVLAKATKDYRTVASPEKTNPDDDATTFYTLNHCASIVRKSFSLNEPLPEWAQELMTAYTDVAMAQGERLLHYLLCITTRETRHMKTGTPTFWNKVKAKWDDKSVDLLKNISSDGDENTAMNKYMLTPPDMTIGQYVSTIAYGFHHGSYAGSYGGKPWGETTDALVAMITGQTSMEMLVDTGYTLCHNGGPIFDKPLLYTHYSGNLITVLDVQRAGGMLDLMFETQTLGVHKTAQAMAAAALIKQHKPEALKGYLDWKLVDELRPQKEKDKHPTKYHKVSGTQKQPMATKPASVKAKPVAPSVLASTLTIHGKKVKVVGEWQVFPNQTVTQVQREQ